MLSNTRRIMMHGKATQEWNTTPAWCVTQYYLTYITCCNVVWNSRRRENHSPSRRWTDKGREWPIRWFISSWNTKSCLLLKINETILPWNIPFIDLPVISYLFVFYYLGGVWIVTYGQKFNSVNNTYVGTVYVMHMTCGMITSLL